MTRRSIEAGKAVIVVDILDKANASFSKLTSKMMASARGLRNLGQQAAGVGLLSGLVSRSVINNFVEFDDKILNLTAKLGIFGVESDKQKATIKDLSKTIIDLGRVTSYTASQVADAAISLAQAGFSATEIKSSLKAVLDLARGTNYALGDTADLLANVVRSFKMFKPGDSMAALEANKDTMTYVSSMLVKATRLGTIEIQDLRESFRYATGNAADLGVKLSTVLGLLVQMSESGLKASLGGTSMNVAMENFLKNSQAIKEQLPEFSISTDKKGNFDFTKSLADLFKATEKFSKVQRTILFGDIFNIRGKRMVSSVQDMERVEFFIKEIQAAAQEGPLAAAKMESGIGGAIRRLINALDTLNIAAGYTFNESAIAMANFATVGIRSLEKFTASHKLLVGALIFSPVIFIGIAASAMILSVVLAKLRTVLIGLASAFNGLKRFGGFLGGSLKNTGGMIAGMVNNRAAKAGLIKKQAEKVAKMEAKINASVAAAAAKKTPAGQASALAKVNASKKMAAFKAEQAKLAEMTKKAKPMAALSRMGSAIAGKASALNNVRKDRADIKGQMKLEAVLQKKNLRDTIAAQKAVKVKAGVELPHQQKMNSLIKNREVMALHEAKLHKRRMAESARYVGLVGKADKKVMDSYRKQNGILQQIQIKAKEEIANNARAAKFNSIQEKTYDRLYAIRKRIVELDKPIDQIVGAKDGKRTPLTQEKLKQMEIARQKQLVDLKMREAKMASIVNAKSATQSSYFQKLEKSQTTRVNALQMQASLSAKLDLADKRSKQIDKMKGIHKEEIATKKHIISADRRIAVQKAQISSSKKLAIIDAQRARASIGAQGMANNAMSQKRVAAAGRAMKGASYMKTLFSGANMAKTFATMGKGVSMIFNLSKSFAILTFRLSRFVFSWNFVGLAFNALLLFGHKIPFIRKAFEDIGSGFGAAFAEIGKIATYAAPALKLFGIAFEAFLKGDTQIGVAAVSAGFSGLVSIIQNQLTAAWNAFAAKVSGIWVVIEQIGTVIWATIDALLKGLGSIASTLAGPLMQGLTGMFSGGGNFADSFKTVFYAIAIGLNQFVTNFSIAITRFITQGYQLVNRFHMIMADVVNSSPGTGNAGAAMREQAEVNAHQDDFNENVNVGRLKGESMKRERIITKAFEQVSEVLARSREAKVSQLNNNSQRTSEAMNNIATTLQYQLQQNQIKRDLDTQRLADLQNRDKSVPGQPAPIEAVKSFGYQLSTLVGSIQQVSGNRLLKESPRELETLQEINENIKDLNQTVKTQGM